MSTDACTQLSLRSQKELAIWRGYPQFNHVDTFEKPQTVTKVFTYSKYGHIYAYLTNESIVVLEASSMKILCEIKRANVVDIWLSPLGSYLASWERPTKSEDGASYKNLTIWDIKDGGKELASFTQKAQNNWSFQWTDDEMYCARLVSGEVHFWESKNAGKAAWKKLKVENVKRFLLSPGKSPAVAVFTPEKSGQPATVRIYGVPSFHQPVSSKTFFKADDVQMYWNTLGTNLLVLTQTEVDKTGKSYYGETNLYYLAVAGNFDCRVPLDKEGPVHHVSWGPDSKEFAVVYGSMPSKATLFNHRAQPIHDFGVNPRNFVSFDPHGRTICIAGFGNLNGTVDMWDRKTLKKVCTYQAANSTHCEWSPCGRFLLTATLTPRLRVDNGFKVWYRDGSLIFEEEMDELYQISFRPEPASNYPVRSTSVPPQAIKILPPKKPLRAGASSAPAGAYRPPHLRGHAETRSLVQLEELHKRGQGAAAAGAANSRQRVPGYVPGAAKPGANKAASKTKQASPTASAATANAVPVTSEEKVKRVRNLEKKLRQINELKIKRNSGETLNEAQVSKIKTETDILRELSSLKLSDE